MRRGFSTLRCVIIHSYQWLVCYRGEDSTRNATGEAESGPLRLAFDRSVKVEFRGSAIGSDGGLSPYREPDDAPGLTDMAADPTGDTRAGKNGRRRLAGLLSQSIFSRLGGLRGRQRC